jgi:methionyl-tRNA formyltransferase
MRIVFMGTPAFAVAAVDALARAGHALLAVVAQPDRPAGRGQALRPPATKAWAEARGIPVLQPEKVRDGRLAAELRALAPDVLVVAAYGRILGRDLLELAPHGAINVHGSLLPRWRGAAPIQWAIAAGDAETGVSIMQMDEGLDTGDVLLQRALAIEPADTAETLAPRLAALGGAALVEALALLERCALVPVRQDEARATHARILEKEDGRIDWTRRADEIAARLRGFTPWPGAWTTLGGKVLKVTAAEVADHASGVGVQASATATGGPAEAERPKPEASAARAAATVSGSALLVPCGAGTVLRVQRVKLEGKGEQVAADLAHGLRRRELLLGP